LLVQVGAGEILRAARERHGIGQHGLARLAHTSQAQISRIERGESSPSVQTLARLVAVMGERLTLESRPIVGNRPLAQLRADYEQLTPSERLAQTAKLSRVLTGIATSQRRR
jgi:transcriptional regulator with XRE-family HTH domain